MPLCSVWNSRHTMLLLHLHRWWLAWLQRGVHIWVVHYLLWGLHSECLLQHQDSEKKKQLKLSIDAVQQQIVRADYFIRGMQRGNNPIENNKMAHYSAHVRSCFNQKIMKVVQYRLEMSTSFDRHKTYAYFMLLEIGFACCLVCSSGVLVGNS